MEIRFNSADAVARAPRRSKSGRLLRSHDKDADTSQNIQSGSLFPLFFLFHPLLSLMRNGADRRKPYRFFLGMQLTPIRDEEWLPHFPLDHPAQGSGDLSPPVEARPDQTRLSTLSISTPDGRFTGVLAFQSAICSASSPSCRPGSLIAGPLFTVRSRLTFKALRKSPVPSRIELARVYARSAGRS
jgi:hypothetical protein